MADVWGRMVRKSLAAGEECFLPLSIPFSTVCCKLGQRRTTVQTPSSGQGKARCKEGGRVGKQGREQPGGWMPRPAHPEEPACLFWRLLPFRRLVGELKNLQFPAATDKAGCWPKCGSRATPCGQITLFRNSSRLSLLLLFLFFSPSCFIPPPPLCVHNPPQAPSFRRACPVRPAVRRDQRFSLLKSEGLKRGPPNSSPPPFFCSFLLCSRFALGFIRAAQRGGRRSRPRQRLLCRSPSRLTSALLPRSSAAGAGCAPGARKSTGCSQNLASMNPGCLLNRERNCVGFPAATPTPSLSSAAPRATLRVRIPAQT